MPSITATVNLIRSVYFAAIIAVVVSLTPATSAVGVSLWVDPDGSDNNNGSPDRPLASISNALERLNALDQTRSSSNNPPLRVILRGGLYQLSSPIKPQIPVVIQAAPGEHPVISGGRQIRPWKKTTARVAGLPTIAQAKIWVADVPTITGRPMEFRQLWVNGNKAIRARAPNRESLAHLLAWDKKHQVATIPAATLLGIQNPAGLEMIIDQVWEIAILRVKSIQIQGTNAQIRFQPPERSIEFQRPWPPLIVTPNYQAPFFLANAIELLDSPGEWFEDVRAGKIYYWPRDGEDLTHASVVAPALETLVQIAGSPDKPATNVRFNGVSFAYTTWLRPSHKGHVPLQAGMFLLNARKLKPKGMPYHPGLDNLAWIGRPPAAVMVKNASGIVFENCTFEHLASAGLDFQCDTHNGLVQGCTFRDIGGNGIQLGKFSDTNVETHVPYNPTDISEVCSGETLANNLITDCGTEDWGCMGVCVGYARNITIAHNEIFNLPYTGISMGWGWTKSTNAMRDNFIFANHVHDVGRLMGDLGGIYTLSAQPGTTIAENSISDIIPSPFVPDPDHWFYLYLDEGSSFITVRDNWCPSEKFLKNANGPGNVWTNNGPQVSERTKNAAGLQPAFANLLKLEPPR